MFTPISRPDKHAELLKIFFKPLIKKLQFPTLVAKSDLTFTDPQCIFDFETRNKQMFTEARAFSRVTYFFIFWRASWIFS